MSNNAGESGSSTFSQLGHNSSRLYGALRLFGVHFDTCVERLRCERIKLHHVNKYECLMYAKNVPHKREKSEKPQAMVCVNRSGGNDGAMQQLPKCKKKESEISERTHTRAGFSLFLKSNKYTEYTLPASPACFPFILLLFQVRYEEITKRKQAKCRAVYINIFGPNKIGHRGASINWNWMLDAGCQRTK